MEEAQIEASKLSICFPNCRKPHLKSQTYLTLVRILSQCANHPQLCGTARRDGAQNPKSDSSSNELGSASDKYNEPVLPHGIDNGGVPSQADLSTSETVKAAGVRDEGLAIGIGDKGFSDAHAVIHELENIMNTEDDDGLCKLKTVTDRSFIDGTGIEVGDFGDLQELLMDELELVIKGNEEVARDKDCNLATGENQCAGDTAVSESEGNAELQPTVIVECSNVGQLQAGKEHSSQNTTFEIPKLSSNNEDRVSLLRNIEVGTSVASQEKETDFGKPAYTGGADSFYKRLAVDDETEEGEISADSAAHEKSVLLSKDAAVLQEQRNQLSEDVDGNKFLSSDKGEENRKDFGEATTREKAEANVKNEMVCKRKIVDYGDPILAEETDRPKRQKKDFQTKGLRKASGDKGKGNSSVVGQIVHPDNSVASIQNSGQTAGDERMKSTDERKKDDGVWKKKRQRPPSEARKAKKKMKERKKRAQKNRELGVKRLKLRPVQNPKPVEFCRHYMKGRCDQGEKCKFSHDTVPLTKSKPCGHFARNSCLKGDDCPYDHELSKYPCSNYASTGFCSRGEACLFSHKVVPQLPIKEDPPSTSNVPTPNHLPKVSPTTLGLTSSKNTAQNTVKSVPSPPVLPPKGITFMSSGKPSIPGSNQSNERLKDGNKLIQSTSEKAQNPNDTPKKSQLSGSPGGINFLSFGKSPLEFSSIKNLTFNSSSMFSTPSSSSIDGAIQAAKVSPSIHHSAVSTSQEPLATPLGSSQPNPFAHSWLKDAPGSAQKAFVSTLAFAAKVESEMKMKQSTSSAIGSSSGSIGDTQCSSKNDSAKAILGFLSSFRSK